MAEKHTDVWKYPHMTYKRAFIYAAVISAVSVGGVFLSFSKYMGTHMAGPIRVNFLTEQEARHVAEEIRKQDTEDRVPDSAVPNENPQSVDGGAGKGGQGGTASIPTRSEMTPTHEKAGDGESGTVPQSGFAAANGEGLAGDPGTGIGRARFGDGQGNSGEEGSGGTGVGEGGGEFDYSGYEDNLRANAVGSYPRQALQMGISGNVTLSITFDGAGNVVDVAVLSSDDGMLSEHAVQMAWSSGGAYNTTGQARTAVVTVIYPAY